MAFQAKSNPPLPKLLPVFSPMCASERAGTRNSARYPDLTLRTIPYFPRPVPCANAPPWRVNPSAFQWWPVTNTTLRFGGPAMEHDGRLLPSRFQAVSLAPHRSPPSREALEVLDPLGTVTRYQQGNEIYGPDDPAEHWYRVIAGMARKCGLTADGRRQIVEFLLPGDFFGLVTRYEHHFAVEAVTDGTEVARYPRGNIERLADFDPRVGRLIREAAFEAISRSQARIPILGRMNARERVGAFLIEMAERSRPAAPDVVVLSMSRYDIADYLGLAAETVSRTLSDLLQSGAIQFEGMRRVRILDRAALEGETEVPDSGTPRTPCRL